jgi:aminoglycoside 3-N-acetyltransferase
MKKKGQIYYRIRYSNFSAQYLCDELEKRIDPNFDVLMVHCAYENLLPMYNQGLMEFLDVLLKICEKRTLAMPAFFFGQPVSAFNLREHYAANPVFYVQKCVSQTGLISEVFRRQKGTKRSLHPSHSICALGPLADRLVNTHHLSPTNFGEGTPFEIMTSFNTVILGIGAPYYRCLTQIHCPEDLLGDAFPINVYDEKMAVILQDQSGEKTDYLLATHKKGLRRNMGLLRKLLTKEELAEWSFHGVPMFTTTAKRVTDVLQEAALQGKTIYKR